MKALICATCIALSAAAPAPVANSKEVPYVPPFPVGTFPFMDVGGDPFDCEGDNLVAMLEYWQKELRMQHWKVAIYCGQRPDSMPGTMGRSAWDLANRYLVIWITKEFPDKCSTVAHELAHGMLNEVVQMKSPQAEEQFVRVFEELLMKRENGVPGYKKP